MHRVKNIVDGVEFWDKAHTERAENKYEPLVLAGVFVGVVILALITFHFMGCTPTICQI